MDHRIAIEIFYLSVQGKAQRTLSLDKRSGKREGRRREEGKLRLCTTASLLGLVRWRVSRSKSSLTREDEQRIHVLNVCELVNTPST